MTGGVGGALGTIGSAGAGGTGLIPVAVGETTGGRPGIAPEVETVDACEVGRKGFSSSAEREPQPTHTPKTSQPSHRCPGRHMSNSVRRPPPFLEVSSPVPAPTLDLSRRALPASWVFW